MQVTHWWPAQRRSGLVIKTMAHEAHAVMEVRTGVARCARYDTTVQDSGTLKPIGRAGNEVSRHRPA